MANVLVEKQTLQDIANAIRTKDSTSETMTPSQMSTRIINIPSGGGEKPVLPNGIHFQSSTNSDMSWLNDVDISQVTTLDSMFSYCSNMTVPPTAWDTKNITNMRSLFMNCSKLESIPNYNTQNVTTLERVFNSCSKITSIPQWNTSKVNNMSYMCAGCTKLETVPLLDTNKITYIGFMQSMFYNCNVLSNESLNNILTMCANSSVTGTSNKTLKHIGLKEAQATTCQSLSNWDNFVAAGWSTGY